jgi:hypothetical protein
LKSESLYGNYHAYLCDARKRLRQCAIACVNWTYPYDGENPPHDALSAKKENRNCDISQSQCCEESVNMKDLDEHEGIERIKMESVLPVPEEEGSKSMNMIIKCEGDYAGSSLPAIGDVDMSSAEDEEKTESEFTEKKSDVMPSTMKCEPFSNSNDIDSNNTSNSSITNVAPNYHSLPSIGESSGYESSAVKGSSESTPENERCDDRQANSDLGVLVNSRALTGESKSKECSFLSQLKETSRENSSEGSVGSSSVSDKNVPRHRLGSGSSIYSRTEDFSYSKSELWQFSRKFSREGSYLDIFNTTPDIGM